VRRGRKKLKDQLTMAGAPQSHCYGRKSPPVIQLYVGGGSHNPNKGKKMEMNKKGKGGRG